MRVTEEPFVPAAKELGLGRGFCCLLRGFQGILSDFEGPLHEMRRDPNGRTPIESFSGSSVAQMNSPNPITVKIPEYTTSPIPFLRALFRS